MPHFGDGVLDLYIFNLFSILEPEKIGRTIPTAAVHPWIHWHCKRNLPFCNGSIRLSTTSPSLISSLGDYPGGGFLIRGHITETTFMFSVSLSKSESVNAYAFYKKQFMILFHISFQTLREYPSLMALLFNRIQVKPNQNIEEFGELGLATLLKQRPLKPQKKFKFLRKILPVQFRLFLKQLVSMFYSLFVR